MQGMAAAALTLWLIVIETWFQGPLLGGRLDPKAALVPALVLLGLAGWLARRAARPAPDASPLVDDGSDRRFVVAVAVILGLATLLRLPALAAPASLISSDSAVAGIIAQELRAGELPAQVYAPGFPYEGTLKPHLTAFLGRLLPRVGTPFLYALASHLFYLLWIAAVMVLARGAGDVGAALGAGLFMAVSPRFLTAFSLNNVGQYPEVNALGATALVLLGRGRRQALAGFVLGLALWQQLIAIYFVLAAGLAVLVTPAMRTPRRFLELTVGFVAGSYPIWIWNATHGWATFDFFRRGAKDPAERLAGLPERLGKTLTLSFPKLFGLSDVSAPESLATALGLALPALVLLMVWRRRDAWRARAGTSPEFLVSVLFAVTVLVFAASKFSHRGAQRPRYLIPIYTPVAVAAGWGAASVARRTRATAALAAVAILALNVAGDVPWLAGRATAETADRAFVGALVGLGIHTGYSGFWIAPKYTFLSEGRFVLSGELGPGVSWVHPGHAALVRARGPDAFVVDGDDLASALARRFGALRVTYERTDVRYAIFHHLSRRVTLEEVAGYELTEGGRPETPEPE